MKVPKSINQLILEIEAATVHIPPSSLFMGSTVTKHNGISCINGHSPQYLFLEDWSGIKKDQLPKEPSLSDSQIQRLLLCVKKLLSAYNCEVIFQRNIPERVQYRIIRDRFNQKVPIQKQEHFSFSLCDQQIPSEDCVMGSAYCHCKLMRNFFTKYTNKEEKEEEIEEFREYILEKRYGPKWRDFLGIEGNFSD